MAGGVVPAPLQRPREGPGAPQEAQPLPAAQPHPQPEQEQGSKSLVQRLGLGSLMGFGRSSPRPQSKGEPEAVSAHC